jgi:hypothetical protein
VITEINSLRDIFAPLHRGLMDAGRLEASRGADSEDNKDDKRTRLVGRLEWLDPESLLG